MLRSVVVALLKELRQLGVDRVGRTKLMKLLYLVDRECMERLGKSCTGVEWMLWLYGPFSREVLDALDQLVEEGVLTSEVEASIRDGELVVSITYGLARSPETSLPPEVENVVRRVARKWGRKSLREILDYVYSLPEVRESALGDRL